MFMNLKKSSSKIVSVVLALTMLCTAAISVSAAEINQSGGSGSTPVNLTTTNGGLNDDGSGGGTQVVTDTSDESSQYLISAPISGCYMSGIGNTSGNAVSVDYEAIVTPLSSAVTNANIANVVFVIEWDTAA